MNNDLVDIRNHLRQEQERNGTSLRTLADLTGVSIATLSRFLRGEEPSYPVLRKLTAFCQGEDPRKAIPVAIREFKVSGKTFIIEIREANI